MAYEKTTDYNAQPRGADKDLRGGTQGGEPERLLDPNSEKEGRGTQDIVSPAGGARTPGKPAHAVPNTDAGRGGP